MILSFDIGIKNMAYTLLNKEDEKIIEWSIIALSGKNIHEISSEIFEKFDEMFQKFKSNITDIVIENQPCFKAPTMKSIQICVYSYFKILYRDAVLHFCSASNKLSLSDKNCKGLNYTQRKKESIRICEQFLEHQDEYFKEVFRKSKKKDDLADAFLQGIYFIRAFQHI